MKLALLVCALGYDKALQPVQVTPRIVSVVIYRVLQVSMNDSALVCLAQPREAQPVEVYCIYDRIIKIKYVYPILRASDINVG